MDSLQKVKHFFCFGKFFRTIPGYIRRLRAVANGARNGASRLADQARGKQEILGIHLPEHADDTDGIAHLARGVAHRRGNRAQPTLYSPFSTA